MPISIPHDLQPFVDRGVASGRFRSEEDAVREGLDLLRTREQRLESLRADIQVGIDQLDSGAVKTLDINDIKRRGREKMASTGARNVHHL